MEALHIGSRREVCWDEYLMDTADGVRVEMHRPEYRDDALVCDAAWEGNISDYFTVIRDGRHLRLYYRGQLLFNDEFGKKVMTPGGLCYAESSDGKTFHRVNVGLNNHWGSLDNNILSTTTGDNIFIFKDTNPDCPPDALFKGLCGQHQTLIYYKSVDGVHFEKGPVIVDDGAYDSLNICFWDDATQRYWLFYRGMHGEATDGSKWQWGSNAHDPEDIGYKYHCKGCIRDVRVRTSKDFIHWDTPQMLQFGPDAPDIELYTNGIQKYPRADHMFIGFPMRYIDRWEDAHNYPLLPDWKNRQSIMVHQEPRSGTAITDAAIMTSRDGVNFRRTEEAYLTPGIERDSNWYYGESLLCYGMVETAADIPGAPNEISMYTHVDYRTKPVTLRRLVTRLDGFFSWRCDYQPGKVVTKPITFQGDKLSMNFATSAFGGVRIRILDEDGNAMDGYDSGVHFGDSVDREVPFAKPLGELSGKPVRLEITMRDADLYSFKFTENVKIC